MHYNGLYPRLADMIRLSIEAGYLDLVFNTMQSIPIQQKERTYRSLHCEAESFVVQLLTHTPYDKYYALLSHLLPFVILE